jgi:FemAB-related protein (PEP-CTERM system-associated)
VTGCDLRIERASRDDASLWRGFLDSQAGAEVGHRWEYLEALRRVYRQDIFRLVATREGRWLAVLPLVLQRSFFGTFLTSVPYLNYAGILGEDREARTALALEALATAVRVRADRLELRGRDGSDLPIDTWIGKASYRLSLEGGVEGVTRRLGTKVGAQVKRPLKEGFASRVAGRGECDRFYPLFARKWHELGSPVLPKAFFEALEDALGEDLRYVFVERDGRVAAAGLLVRAGESVEISWAASAREHDRVGVNMLLYGRAIEHAAAAGARFFDFGRSTPSTSNARFKLQWGAQEMPLAWNVAVRGGRARLAERGDERRSLAAAAWKCLPRFAALALGPRLAARIPY